jgi:hypothetical protein
MRIPVAIGPDVELTRGRNVCWCGARLGSLDRSITEELTHVREKHVGVACSISVRRHDTTHGHARTVDLRLLSSITVTNSMPIGRPPQSLASTLFPGKNGFGTDGEN